MKIVFKSLLLAVVPVMCTKSLLAIPVVPGTGRLIEYVGDDFEDPKWSFNHNHPKSSEEINGNMGGRQGKSTNGRWYEGPKRGQPDKLQVVRTPPGGIEGSKGSLLMHTLNSGVPGSRSNKTEQDDLVVDCHKRLKTTLKPTETPSCVVRIYLPPFEHWEDRSGPHFGLRFGCSTPNMVTKSEGFFGGSSVEPEQYWPGIWIHFRSKTDKKNDKDSAFLKVRGDTRGRDFYVRDLEQPGWWTMGMSITPDGQVHYYASPGSDDLTLSDYMTSQFPYGYKPASIRTFFFNLCNRNDGYSWSTPFVIDDPRLYLVDSSRVISIREQELARKRKIAEAKKARAERIKKQKELAKKRAEERKKQLAERRQKANEQAEAQAKNGTKNAKTGTTAQSQRKKYRRKSNSRQTQRMRTSRKR